MKVLVVDDEISKAAAISRVLSADSTNVEVHHASTATAARQELRRHRYSMMVVDLHLPAALDDRPDGDGGFDLVNLLLLDNQSGVPNDLIFITSRDELLEEAKLKALRLGASLFHYRDVGQWTPYIQGRVGFLIKTGYPKEATADIVIVTALADPELAAVKQLQYDWRSERLPGDPTRYHLGTIPRPNGPMRVVAACANRKGMPSSAALASKMVTRFRPKFLVMLGICAGVPNKVGLGDIVIADPAWDYGSGKRAIDDWGSPVFLAAPYQTSLDSSIRSLADELARDPTVRQRIKVGWQYSTPEGMLRAHVGPMASGSSVIADDDQARLVALQQREVVAIEMEAYAVMAAVEYASNPTPKAIVIKSVCDFADSAKNDHWQSYAAYTSAAFADLMFRHDSFDL